MRDAASFLLAHRYGWSPGEDAPSAGTQDRLVDVALREDPELYAASGFAQDAALKLRWTDCKVLPPRPMTRKGPGGAEIPTGGQVVLVSGPTGSIDPQKLLATAQGKAAQLGISAALGVAFSTPVNGVDWTFQPVTFF